MIQPTIEELLPLFQVYLRAAGMSERTVEVYTYHLKEFIRWSGNLPIPKITPNVIRTFLAEKRRRSASWSVYRAWVALRSFWRFLEEEFDMPNVMERVKSPKVEKREVRSFTPEEIRRILQAVEYTRPSLGRREGFRMRRPTHLRDRAIILFLLDTGIRASELCNLLIRDVDLKTGEVRIQRGKGGKERDVYIGASTRKALLQYLMNDRPDADPSDFLFVTNNGMPFNRDTLGRLLRRVGARAGVQKVHAHRFRHTFAIMFLRNGGNAIVLKKLLGHETFEMVEVYLEIARSDLKAAHRKASPVDHLMKREPHHED